MKRFRSVRAVPFAAAVLLGLASAGVAADMPRGEYACQVEAAGGFHGFVLVQADDYEEAGEMAMRNPATTFDGYQVKPAEFVECILLPDGRFRDTSFQDRFERLER